MKITYKETKSGYARFEGDGTGLVYFGAKTFTGLVPGMVLEISLPEGVTVTAAPAAKQMTEAEAKAALDKATKAEEKAAARRATLQAQLAKMVPAAAPAEPAAPAPVEEPAPAAAPEPAPAPAAAGGRRRR